MDQQIHERVAEVHKDLKRKYRLHGYKVRQLWLSFNKDQRKRVVQAGSNGVMLKHAADTSLHNVFKMTPEWNLDDLTKPSEPGSDWLLDQLHYRATNSLFDQYCYGGMPHDDKPGDLAVIQHSMAVYGLRHVNKFRNCFTIFTEVESTYGRSYEVDARRYHTISSTGSDVPRGTGELVLIRQQTLIILLSSAIDDILYVGATLRVTQKGRDKDHTPAAAALCKLAIADDNNNSLPVEVVVLSMAELVAMANDYCSVFDDYVKLLATEPVVLTHALNNAFFTQPGLVHDEKGRVLPVITDSYIGPALFDVVHGAIVAAAIWNYVCRLLSMLMSSLREEEENGKKSLENSNSNSSTKKKKRSKGKGKRRRNSSSISNDSDNSNSFLRTSLLQRLADVCHAEYVRVQKAFKRQVQSSAWGCGAKHFRRVSNAYDIDKGITGRSVPRVNQKKITRGTIRRDIHLHYVLQLCLPSTSTVDATGYMKKLDELYRADPCERDKLSASEVDALGDMAIIVNFMQLLSLTLSKLVLPIPSVTRQKGKGKKGIYPTFLSRAQDLAAEIAELRRTLGSELDLSDYVIPMDNLREPGVASAALHALDGFVVRGMGASIGVLYRDMVESCISDILAEVKSRAVEKESGVAEEESREVKAVVATESVGEGDVQVFFVPLAEGVPSVGDNDSGRKISLIQEIRERHKTRPSSRSSSRSCSCFLDVNPSEDTGAETKTEAEEEGEAVVKEIPPGPTFRAKVKPTTYLVFTRLFAKQAAHQGSGSIAWTAFERAMVDLGFSVVPKYGSVITFVPPSSWPGSNGEYGRYDGVHVGGYTVFPAQKSVTLHRPHGPRIEGHKLRMIASRLAKVYSWGMESFERVERAPY